MEGMSLDIHVSNLSPETTREDLRKVFTVHGEVSSVGILTEKRRDGLCTGPSRGYGFVAMPDNAGARAAISALDHHEIRGFALRVQEARPSRVARHRR